jgi:hypothetical protein
MFISTRDTQVPTRSHLEAWEKFRRSRVIFFDRPHYEMITRVPFTHNSMIRDFYRNRFGG